jgi:hypothetical protein
MLAGFRNALRIGCEVPDEKGKAYRKLCAALNAERRKAKEGAAERARIVVHVQGGLVHQIIADRDIEVLLVDYDNEEVEQAEQAEAEDSGQQWKSDRSWGKLDLTDAERLQAWAEGRETE